jgi:uncharacterized protein (DUF1501 family)
MSMLDRRTFLQALGAGTLVATSPGLAFARGRDDARFVLVLLRGAADGLAIAPPFADPDYARARGELAIARPGQENGALALDGFFGLHPRLETVHKLYLGGDALLVHAVASPYRDRSHFDGQDVLENGGSRVGAMRDGWLNRALHPLGGGPGDELAVALAQNTPLVLRGSSSVTSWAPSRLPNADDDLIDRLRLLYADEPFFSERLEQAIESQRIASGMGDGMGDGMDKRRGGGRRRQLAANLDAAARFLVAPDGPGIAVVESGGWDTHANQGAGKGALANQLGALDEGLGKLKAGLGERWRDTVVAVVTEFGRTVRVNGTRGTDHGTGTAALLLGGRVDGSKVVADWPGLGRGALYEGRDLRPTTDLRSVFKSVLADHLSVPRAHIEREVFPDSRAAPPLEGLLSA